MIAAARRLRIDEALPAAGLLIVAMTVLGMRPVLLGFVWLAAVTPRLVATDLAEHRLPDVIVLPGYPVALAAVALDAWAAGRPLAEPLLAAAACGLVFLLLHVVGGMGFGDVKLAPLLGALVAAAAPGGALIWVMLAFLVGGVGAVVVLVRRGTGAHMPFGPPMLAAAWLTPLLLLT